MPFRFRPSSLVLLVLFLGACESPDASGASEAVSSDELAARHVETADSLANVLIARADSALEHVDVMTGSEESQLRRYFQSAHMRPARMLGIEPVFDRTQAAALAASGDVVRVRTNDSYIIDPRMGYAVPVLVRPAAHLLDLIARRFQQDLEEADLPPYRFIVTSLLRTARDQNILQGTNANAARGTSTHEYGTTFDIYYERFHYAPARDSVALAAASRSDIDRPRFLRWLREGYGRLGLSDAERLKGVLGRTLIDLQNEGLLLAIYERGEPVFHLTVAQDLPSPDGDTSENSRDAVYANVESLLADVDDDIEDMEDEISEAPDAGLNQLAVLRTMRDSTRALLERFGGFGASSSEDHVLPLRRTMADLEGQVERTEVAFVSSAQRVRNRLQSRAQRLNLALETLEARISYMPEDERGDIQANVADLRQQHGELLAAAEQVSTDEGFQAARSDAADRLAWLVAETYLVVEHMGRIEDQDMSDP